MRASLPLNVIKNLGNKLKSVLVMGMTSPDALTANSQVDDGLSVYSGNVFFKKDLKPIELTAGEAYTGADIVIPADGMHKVLVHVEEMTRQPTDVAQVNCSMPMAKIPCAADTLTITATAPSTTFPTGSTRYRW